MAPAVVVPLPNGFGEKPLDGTGKAAGAAQFAQVESLRPTQPVEAVYKDVVFAVLFIANVIAMIVIMAGWGVKSLSNNSDYSVDEGSIGLFHLAIGLTVAAALLAMLEAVAVMSLLVRNPESMIRATVWLNIVFTLLAISSSFLSLSAIGISAFGVFMLLFLMCYSCHVWKRIPFAAANIRVAGAAMSCHGSLYFMVVGVALLQVVWVAIWTIAFLGIRNSINGEAVGIVKLFFILLSLYWGIQVLKNISHGTVAGVVGMFIYSPEATNTVSSSFKRCCTTSFGSICMGSLLVAILQALRSAARGGSRSRSMLAFAFECILGCIESIVEYINQWAFVYVALYGQTFMDASSAAMNLFKHRGFTAIVNDGLISGLLSMCAVGIGLFSACFGVVVGYLSYGSDGTVIGGFTCLIAGLCASLTPLSVMESAVMSIFVCFSEDPVVFQRNHPELFHLVIVAWQEQYSEVLTQAHYVYY